MSRTRLLLSAILVAASTLVLPLQARAQAFTGMTGPTVTVNTPSEYFDPNTWVRTFDFTSTGFHVGFNPFPAYDQGQTATFNFTLSGASSLDGVNFDGCFVGGGVVDNPVCGTSADGFSYGALGLNQNAGPNATWAYWNSYFTAKLSGTTLELTAKGPVDGVGFNYSDVYFTTTAPEPATVSLMAVGMLALGVAARRQRRA